MAIFDLILESLERKEIKTADFANTRIELLNGSQIHFSIAGLWPAMRPEEVNTRDWVRIAYEAGECES